MTRALAASDRFEPTGDERALSRADAVIVCVPTPLNAQHEPDLSYVLRTGEAIGRTLRRGQLIVLESTSYPGTTRDDFLPAIESAHAAAGSADSGGTPPLAHGRDFFVAFSPEREDPGRTTHTTRTIPKLVGGLDDAGTQLAAALYRRAVEHVVPVDSAETAEAAKILENVFRAVNIALVNELKVIFDAMGIDVWRVVRAAATKPFGFMPFYPGPGLGGHCIPVDPFYLSWKAAQIGRPTRFIELAGEINTGMPALVVERAAAALRARGRTDGLRGARVLVLGLAYKPDIDDTRESPSFALIDLLRRAGAQVEYSDPHIPRTVPVRKHDLRMTSVDLTPASVASFDALLVATNHKAFDYALIARHARLVIDTRDALRAFEGAMGDRLVRA
jgi:UDP-N-acetyl-D-glucosamine dehydrogenase